MTHARPLFLLILILAPWMLPAGSAPISAKPKVRAITAFIRIDRIHPEVQVQEALTFLRTAKAAYEAKGYAVETIRITTQPFPEIVSGLDNEQAMAFFKSFDALAKRESFLPNIGAAMLAGTDTAEAAGLLGRILSETELLHASIIVAEEDGIHWNRIHAAAKTVKFVAEHSPRGEGNFRLAATAMLAPYAPFFPGSYHTGEGHQFSVGLESANVVQAVLENEKSDLDKATQSLSAELSRFDSECEQIAKEIEKSSKWVYAGLDPTPAPLAGVSIGDAIEKFIGGRFGSSGTLAAAAMITRAVKTAPIKQTGYVGLMVPVMEDNVLARRWSESAYNIDSLLSYSAVCGTGLDTVPLPGEVSEEQLARIIGDMASLAFKWKKPLSARLLPVPGKNPGDRTEFENPALTNVMLQKLP
jgi:uncharacterized protein